MALYRGDIIGGTQYVTVFEGNTRYSLPMALEVHSHSPSGFAWGYEGRGCSQLALAILVNEFGNDLSAHPVHYQTFMAEIVAQWPTSSEWAFTSQELTAWINQQEMAVN